MVARLTRPTRFAPERLRAARLDFDLTLLAFADFVGCHETSLSEWERGLSTPSLDSFIRLVEALGCDPHALLTDNEESLDGNSSRSEMHCSAQDENAP
jgi:transcriptional regulator with XRE-family HTH domain